MSVIAFNPCINCGACCACFRASFYWTEASPEAGGTVPPELTEKLDNHRVVMQGTNCKSPRCIALQGTIGVAVACSIYPLRSSVCRDFPYAWQDGDPHDRCDRARALHGLPPLEPPEPIALEPDFPRTPRAA